MTFVSGQKGRLVPHLHQKRTCQQGREKKVEKAAKETSKKSTQETC